MKKSIIIIIFVILILIGSLLYFRNEVYYSHGTFLGTRIFKIEKGQSSDTIAINLFQDGLISGKWYFFCYLKTHRLSGKILPGEYELSGSMTIGEIAVTITQEQNKSLKITFPEGWDSKKMAERLAANGFSKEEFLNVVDNPPKDLTDKFSFFAGMSNIPSLEGYLFPDTYFFSQKHDVNEVVKKMLTNFDQRLTPELRTEIKKQRKSVAEVITMASILEREVKTEEDRAIVSGIFWKRLRDSRTLQSCATLAYILGVNKKQYTFEDTRIDSPYNTYLYKGLPPGPISNPGIISIKATLYPKESPYSYFLSDPETGTTVFSKTIEEHNANKAKYGL